MICKLCFIIYVENISFITMFRPEEFCPSCRKKYQPKYEVEIIPRNNGYISYHTVFSFGEDNPYIKKILFRTMKPYFLQLMKMNLNEVIILIIDDYEYETLLQWYPLFKDAFNVFFLSVFHYDFSIYSNFMF